MPNKENVHKKINRAIYDELYNVKNFTFIDVNNYIKSNSDYFDNINHYSKLVYYSIAKDLISIINSDANNKIKIKSHSGAVIDDVKRKLYKTYLKLKG